MTEDCEFFVASDLSYIRIRKGDDEVKLSARKAIELSFWLAEVVEEMVRVLLGEPTHRYDVSPEKLKGR